MLPVFADPKTDFVFKRIFGDEKHKSLLIALLNDLLELKGTRRITDIEHLPAEQRVAVPEMKLSIVDVKCTTARGRRFVVEMQVAKVEGLEKRIVYNASKAYVMQLRTAEKYPTLCNVVGVTICNFNVWSKGNKNGKSKVPMLSRWRMQEQHSKVVGIPQVQYVFLELPKYSAGNHPETMIDKWAYFFREANDLSVEPQALSEAPFHEALEVARTATFTPVEWEAYERAKMAEQDARGMLAVARKEGHKEGHKEGEVKAKIAAILTVLAARGVAMSHEVRARVEACEDGALLDRWIVRAATAASAEELFSEHM